MSDVEGPSAQARSEYLQHIGIDPDKDLFRATRTEDLFLMVGKGIFNPSRASFEPPEGFESCIDVLRKMRGGSQLSDTHIATQVSGQGATRLAVLDHTFERGRPTGDLVSVFVKPLDRGLDPLAVAQAVVVFAAVECTENMEHRETLPREGVGALREAISRLNPGVREWVKQFIAGAARNESNTDPVWQAATALLKTPDISELRAIGIPNMVKVKAFEAGTPLLSELHKLVSDVIPSSSGASQLGLAEAANVVASWGYTRIRVHADVSDVPADNQGFVLEPLLEAREGIDLPLVITAFGTKEQQSASWPKFPERIIPISWSPASITVLVQGLYRTAGARRGGLSDVVIPELASQIDDLVVNQARMGDAWVPARVIHFLSNLFDVQADRHREGKRKIDQETLDEAQERTRLLFPK